MILVFAIVTLGVVGAPWWAWLALLVCFFADARSVICY